jgi:hypothetical protein
MSYRRIVSALAGLVLLFALNLGASARSSEKNESKEQKRERVVAPINLAILIQDDLIPQVDNELSTTRDFIRTLPKGSRVMVGYITTGSLQVRQPFTTDLEKAANSLRVLHSSTSSSAFNPYVELMEALKRFDGLNGPKAVLMISDGLDTSRGFDSSAAGNTLDIRRSIEAANEKEIAVYTFYAPSVGLTSRNRLAASYGQSSLNRLSRETGGRAFFQGTTGFVSFDGYFRGLRESLNDQYARAY